ncbi:MAG: DUF4276 family protein [Sphingomonas sp.]|nr:DUF4276 family protein [Sphingomonas sp.]
MIYLSWAALHEGSTDRAYFDVLIPRVMEDFVLRRGIQDATVPQTAAVRFTRSGRRAEEVAADICRDRDAFHIVYIHADTGGRALEAAMPRRSDDYRTAAQQLCGFIPERCVIMAPRHETEAWILADLRAVCDALGYRGDLAGLGLPRNAREAEKLVDPKSSLRQIISQVRGRRGPADIPQLASAVAQRQDLSSLSQSISYQKFESEVERALVSLGCIV